MSCALTLEVQLFYLEVFFYISKPRTYVRLPLARWRGLDFYFLNSYAAACFEPTSVELHRDPGPFGGRFTG